jgi:tetratricopeptide (TPR) repeat protein
MEKDTNTDNLISKRLMYLPILVALTLGASVVAPASAGASDAQWDYLQAWGADADRKSEYGEAERCLTQAVKRARTFPQGDQRLATSAGELGRLLTIRGRFPEAQQYLEEELRVKMASSDITDAQLIPPMGSLVRFYLNYGTTGKADPLAEKILGFINGKLAEVGDKQGKVAFKQGMPLQAWAGEAAPAARDPLIDWAITCDDLGNLYAGREDATTENLAMAERLFKAALDVKSTVLGKQHLSLANSYDSLGSLCMQRKQYQDAESWYRDALDITEKILPPEDRQVYSRIDKLGRCLIKEEKWTDAEALYQRAQGLWKSEPSHCGNEFRAAYALGSLYAQEKKYQEAAPYLEQALSGAEVYMGPESVTLVPFLQRYAYVLYYLGRRAESEPLRARAKEIQPVIEVLTMKAKKLDP